MQQRSVEKLNGLVAMVGLALSAMAPLAVFVSIRLFARDWTAFWIFLAIAFIGALCLRLVLWASNHGNTIQPRNLRVENAGGEVSVYMLSFVLPFLVGNAPKAQDIVALTLFVVLYIIVAISTDLIIVNPLLFIFGYRIWRVHSADFEVGYAYFVSRARPSNEGAVRMVGRGRIYVEGDK